MALYNGDKEIHELYNGDTYIEELYNGDTKIFDAGWSKTITGNLPLTLSDCRSKALTKCEINPYLAQNGVTVNGKLYKVPDGYTLLDSIEGTGYIKTGIHANPAVTNTKMRVAVTDTSGTTALFGTRVGTTATARSYSIFGSVSSTNGRFDNVNPSHPFVFTSNRWYDIELGHNGPKGTVTIDGVLIHTSSSSMENSDCGEIYIGCLNNNGIAFSGSTPSKWGIVEIYADGTNLSGYFHPAKRNSDNAVGMVNVLDGTWHGTESGGSRTAGKDTRTINMHQEIPEELYQEVGYLQLSGTQYIDTGINPSSKKIGAVIDFQFTSTSDATRGIFGSNKTDGTDNCQFTVYESKWRTKINSFANYGANYDTNRHTVSFNMTDGTKLDDTVITTTQYTIASTNNVSLLLGACSYKGSPITSGSIRYTFVGKLYPSKIYVDGTLTLDFVPVKRLSDDAYGMYDLMSKTFYGNAGTGTITGGTAYQMEVPTCTVERSGDKTVQIFDKATMGTPVNVGLSDAGSARYATGTAQSRSFVMPVEPNTNYNVSVQGTFEGSLFRVATTATLVDSTHQTVATIAHTNKTSYSATTINSGADAHYLYAQFTAANIDAMKDILVVVKGTAAPTAYIPYGWKYETTVTHDGETETIEHYSQMLQGSIDLASGAETEEWGSHTFDGTESFVSEGILDNCWCWSTRLESDTTFTDRTAYCNEFKHSSTLPSAANREGYVLLGKITTSGQSKPQGKYVGFGLPACFDTEAKVKAWIAGKTVYWQKKTPTTSQGQSHTITPNKGTNTIDCEQSRTCEVEYISRTA